MMAESGQAGNTKRRHLARIVHGTDREPQLEPGSETPWSRTSICQRA